VRFIIQLIKKAYMPQSQSQAFKRAVTQNKENKLKNNLSHAVLIGRVMGHRDGFGFMQRDASEPEGEDVFLPCASFASRFTW
jgi:exoribonuclease R